MRLMVREMIHINIFQYFVVSKNYNRIKKLNIEILRVNIAMKKILSREQTEQSCKQQSMLNIITSAAALPKFLSLTTTATPKFEENIYTKVFIYI